MADFLDRLVASSRQPAVGVGPRPVSTFERFPHDIREPGAPAPGLESALDDEPWVTSASPPVQPPPGFDTPRAREAPPGSRPAVVQPLPPLVPVTPAPRAADMPAPIPAAALLDAPSTLMAQPSLPPARVSVHLPSDVAMPESAPRPPDVSAQQPPPRARDRRPSGVPAISSEAPGPPTPERGTATVDRGEPPAAPAPPTSSPAARRSKRAQDPVQDLDVVPPALPTWDRLAQPVAHAPVVPAPRPSPVGVDPAPLVPAGHVVRPEVASTPSAGPGPPPPDRVTLPAMAAAQVHGQPGAPPQPPPTIQVTIGRIEVRAVPPPSAPARQPARPPIMTLDEYLRQRNGGKP